jgi:hypothetical protein
VKCPNCEQKFVVPLEEQEQDDPGVVGSYAVTEAPPAARPGPPPIPPRRRIRYEDDDRDDDVERPRPRRRVRRRRRQEPSEWFGGWGWEKIALMVLAGVWLASVGVAFIVPPVALLIFAGGFVLLLCGRIWAIVAAFSEDSSTGCTVLLFPWYGLLNLEDRRPLLVMGVGVLFVLSGLGVAVVTGAFK